MENKTVGILYPGDLGRHLAMTLKENGWKIISIGKDRSENTQKNMFEAGIEDAGTLKQLVSQVAIVLSVVTPQDSLHIANAFVDAVGNQTPPIFLDLNSNTPQEAIDIEQALKTKQIPFVNGAVLGPSGDLPYKAPILVCGHDRHQIIEQFGQIFKIQDCGAHIGAASAFKLLFSGFNKGTNALLFETMIAANHFGIMNDLLLALEGFRPGTFKDLEKTTPTYPMHIKRRAEEMAGLVSMLQIEGLPYKQAEAAESIFRDLSEREIFVNEGKNTVESVILQLKKWRKE